MKSQFMTFYNTLAHRIPYFILLIVALACLCLGTIMGLFFGIGIAIICVVTIAPSILLFLYIVRFNQVWNPATLIALISALITARSFFSGGPFGFFSLIPSLITAVAFGFVTIYTLSGLNETKHMYIALAASVGIVCELLSFLLEIIRIFNAWYSPLPLLATCFFESVGSLCLFGVLLRFGSPQTIQSPKSNRDATPISPEELLYALKEKRDLNLISEKEYQDRRAYIISKL